MAIIKIRNTAIDLDAAEIPNLDASKITTGSLGADRIPDLAASKITSGTFADARIAASNVTQHATDFDDDKIINDISTLAIRQASNENKGAYNTNSMYVDVFQDSTGIDTTTNTERNILNEFMGTGISATDTSVKFLITGNGTGATIVDSLGNHTVTVHGGTTWSSADKKFGTSSLYFDGNGDYLEVPDSNDWYFGNSGNGWTFETWYKPVTATGYLFQQGISTGNGNPRNHFQVYSNTFLGYYDSAANITNEPTISSLAGSFNHMALVYDGTDIQFAVNGVWVGSPTSYSSPSNNSNPLRIGRGQTGSATTSYIHGYLDGIKISEKNQYTIGTNFNVPTSKFSDQALTINSTGNFTGNAITAPSSVSSMGAIITYQDNVGTNTLNTDIVLKLSADNGSNYSTATLTAMPDFSSGIKMAKVNDLAVTAGTQLKYKIEFANQSASKEARIRGVSLQY